MIHDYSEGTLLKQCPDDVSYPLGGWLYYPTTSFILASTAIVSFAIAIVTTWKYNSVRVFHQKIRTANISNTLWIFYFTTLGLRCAVDTARFANFDPTSKLDSALFLTGVVLHGIAGLFLGLALNHQRKFRSSNPSEPLLEHTNQKQTASNFIHDFLLTTESFFYGAFFVYIVLFLLMTIYDNNDALFWPFLTCLWVQRSLLILFTCLIIIRPTTSLDGPSTRSKVFLGLATILNLANDVPATIWQSVFPLACTFYIGTGVDFLLVFIIPSIVFYFMFLKIEYQRNMEECIWTTVSQIQDSWTFKPPEQYQER